MRRQQPARERFQPTRGQRLGGWVVEQCIGGGGNATVWTAVPADARDGGPWVIKICRSLDRQSERFQRFENEIQIMEKLSGHAGVLPLEDSDAPSEHGAHAPIWYVTPRAVPVRDALREADLLDVVRAVASIAETLARLHYDGVVHRDIKPQNLYRYDEGWVIGDFGIATQPDPRRPGLTTHRIGPRNYLPPELERHASEVTDPRPGDVYMLAKTLWVIATNESDPHQGHQPAESDLFRLESYVDGKRTRTLDLLVERATAPDPDARPQMRDLQQELVDWCARDEGGWRINSIEDARAQAVAEIRSSRERSRWGEWHYDEKLDVYSCSVEGSGLEFSGSQLGSALGLLRALADTRAKQWATASLVADLVAAADNRIGLRNIADG